MLSNCELEKTLESLLESNEMKPSYPEKNQPWIFTGRTDAETEATILWSPNANWWLIGKDLDARKDWGQEEKGATEDDIVGWHHWLNGHEFEQTQGDREGQGGLVCCSPWACKELDTNERVNNSRCYSWCYEYQCSLWCWEYNFERENKDSDSILFCPVRNMVVGGNTYQGVTVVM